METQLWKITDVPIFQYHRTGNTDCFNATNASHLPYRVSWKVKGDDQVKDTVIAWLTSKVGEDFDLVYAEFQKFLQPIYLDGHQQGLFWYVERKEAILMDEDGRPRYKGGFWFVDGFYVNPETNCLSITN